MRKSSRMKTLLSVLTMALSVAFLAVPLQTAHSMEGTSDWVSEGASRVRLIIGGPNADGTIQAGLEFDIAPGWKTYWINPGPTGLAPRLDFSGSLNFASAQPHWPAPVRFEDGGTAAIGYKGAFVVPLTLEPRTPGKRMVVKARLDYGLCETICVPAQAVFEVEVRPDGITDPSIAVSLRDAMRKLPKPARIGEGKDLAILGVSRTRDGLGVDVRFPEGAMETSLFASAPGVAVGVPQRLVGGDWRIKLRSGAPPSMVELVAVADDKSIKVPVALDALPLKP